MKKLLIFAAATLAFVALSCQKNTEDPTTQEPQFRTFTCTIADVDPDSKMTYTKEGNKVKTRWEAGDEILFHGKHCGGGYSSVVTLAAGDISEDGKTFTKAVPEFTNGADHAKWNEYGYDSNIIVAYPASAVITSEGGSQNWYGINKFNESNLPLLSGFNDGYDSNHIIMYNLCGIISFSVTGDYDGYIFEGNKGETVAYSGYWSRLYKKLSDGSHKLDWVYSGTGLTSVSGSLSSGATQMVCIPGGVSFEKGFTIYIKKGSEILKTISTQTEKSIPRNGFLMLGDLTSHMKTYVPPATHTSSIITDGATALDASGYANCYCIPTTEVSANQVFTFRAYRGNSTDGVGTVASADIIWETYNDETASASIKVIEAVDFEKKADKDYYTMVFQMPSTIHAGNALIAAKNAGGGVLWSWHIWVPSTTVDDIDASNICGATMMDRNLGALEKVSTTDGANVYSLGLIYQWGRKDPFPGGKRITDTWPNPATVAGTAPSVGGSMTMDEAIANPTVFGSVDSGDWQTTSDMTRWIKDSKTINDPCPPGYRVPYGDRNSKPLWNTSNIATAVTSAGLTWELSSTGYWFRIADGTKELVFPFAGYVSDGTSSYGLGYVQTRAAIWSLSDSSSSKYHLNIRSGSTTAFSSTSASRGCSVRCVAVAE